MADVFSALVRELLRTHITSFEKLEFLRLLHQRPDEQWTPLALAERIGVSDIVASDALRELQANGLIACEGAAGNELFRYAPANASLSDACDDLVLALETQRAAVLGFMSVNAIDRVRSDAIRAFADSFVFVTKKSDP